MKVFVILPTYNEAGNIVALIDRGLKSIPATAEPEVLIVDDNSPDGTYRIAADRFTNDPRVVLIRRIADRGRQRRHARFIHLGNHHYYVAMLGGVAGIFANDAEHLGALDLGVIHRLDVVLTLRATSPPPTENTRIASSGRRRLIQPAGENRLPVLVIGAGG